jgi:hypothetical protein
MINKLLNFLNERKKEGDEIFLKTLSDDSDKY